jgi:hypothetical protein
LLFQSPEKLMAESFVQVPPDGTGKQIATILDVDGYERQIIVWGDSTTGSAILAAVKAASVSPQTTVDGAGVVVLRPDSISNDGGVPINSATIPTGGVGLTGWLSACWSVLGQIYTKLNASIAVTGTFWQTTQPVSGTFWQATQPVSGTFWQTTQPVSIGAPVTIAGGNKPVGPANISTQQSTIGTSVQLVVGQRAGSVGVGRCSATLKNTGTVPVFLGGPGVSSSTGFPLNPGEVDSFDTASAIYGIAASGSNVVCVMETF